MHELRLKWWQAGIYEASLLSLGFVVGARWFSFFQSYSLVFLAIFLLYSLVVASAGKGEQFLLLT